jgi:hypothetical protein
MVGQANTNVNPINKEIIMKPLEASRAGAIILLPRLALTAAGHSSGDVRLSEEYNRFQDVMCTSLSTTGL